MTVGEITPFVYDFEQATKTAVRVAAQGITVSVRSIKCSTFKTYFNYQPHGLVVRVSDY